MGPTYEAAFAKSECLSDDLFRVVVRVVQVEPPVGVVAGVDHRTDRIYRPRQLLDLLADALVVCDREDDREDIGRHRAALGIDPFPGLTQEGVDRRHPALLGGSRLRVVVHRNRGLAIGRESHVVELDFVESEPARFDAHPDRIVPRFGVGGIHPSDALPVAPRFAGLAVEDGPIGKVLRRKLVLEGDDPGDRVETMLLGESQALVDVVLIDDGLHRERLVVLRQVHHLAELVLGVECECVDDRLIGDPEQLSVLGVGGVVSEYPQALDDERSHRDVLAVGSPIPLEGRFLPGRFGDGDLTRGGGNHLERAEFGGDDFLLTDPHRGSDDPGAVVGHTSLEDEWLHLQLERSFGGEGVDFVGGGVISGRFDPKRGRGVEDDEGAPALDAGGLVPVVGRNDCSGQRSPFVSDNCEVSRLGLDHAGDHPDSHDESNDGDGNQQDLECVLDEPGTAQSVTGAVAPPPAEDFETWAGASADHGSTTCRLDRCEARLGRGRFICIF